MMTLTMVSATDTQNKEQLPDKLLRREIIKKMAERLEAEDQQLLENTPSAEDFYRLLRDTDFSGLCSELASMMEHPYLISVSLGMSKYGEHNIRISLLELRPRKKQRPFDLLNTTPREFKLSPGQMGHIYGIDSGPEDLRYFFQLGR